MTILKYTREYYNPSGISANTPEHHSYDTTKPTRAPVHVSVRPRRCWQPGCPIWTCGGSKS